METHQDMKRNGHIPIGLISGKVVAKKAIKQGQFLTIDNVELDPSTTVWKLRELQNHLFPEDGLQKELLSSLITL